MEHLKNIQYVFKPLALHIWLQLSVLFQKPVEGQKNI